MNENKRSRRRILKSLAITLPAAWSAPLVKSVVLPAHAQTSQCEAPEGCYLIGIGGGESVYISWAGGTGPHTAPGYQGPGCQGQSAGTGYLIVASSAEEAAALLSCSVSNITEYQPVSPPLPGGCGFYECINN